EVGFRADLLEDLPGPDGQPVAVYNFGVPAIGPLHQYLHLQEMLDAGIRPRLLLVEFLPPLLNAPRRGIASEEQWTWAPGLSAREYLRLRPYLARPRRKGRDWLESRLAPWYTLRPQLHACLAEHLVPRKARPPQPPPHDARGW